MFIFILSSKIKQFERFEINYSNLSEKAAITEAA